MNDTDNDTIIFTFIQENEPVPLQRILKELMPKGRGYSESTIKKRLGRMVNQKKIRQLDLEEYSIFGISNEDHRVTYYVSVNVSDIVTYVNTQFDNILSKNTSVKDKISALDELDLYKFNSVLTPKRLDDLCTIIDISEETFTKAIDILEHYIIIKHILPLHRELCIKKLNDALVKFKKNTQFQHSLVKVFKILAYYSDDSLIEQLERDAWDGETLHQWINYYSVPGIVKILEKNRERLRKLMDELKEKGRPDIAEDIRLIRINALNQEHLLDVNRRLGLKS